MTEDGRDDARNAVRIGAALGVALHVFAGTGGAAAETGTVCAFPVVLRAGLRDIHESPLNGPEGYAFFREAGGEKTGELPAAIGRDPVRRFDTAVYASNFQGPTLVRHADLRPQWEWTADGETQISERQYPVPAARACAADAGGLPAVTLHVDEHDEWPWGNDPVGAFTLDLASCRDVLGPPGSAGWTSRRRSEGMPYDGDSGPRDVVFVDYVVWCYPCAGTSDCEDGVVWERIPAGAQSAPSGP